MNKYNNKQKSTHWSGKVYITHSALGHGGNICVDPRGDDDFIVIAYTHKEITEEVIRMHLKAFGYDPDEWL